MKLLRIRIVSVVTESACYCTKPRADSSGPRTLLGPWPSLSIDWVRVEYWTGTVLDFELIVSENDQASLVYPTSLALGCTFN